MVLRRHPDPSIGRDSWAYGTHLTDESCEFSLENEEASRTSLRADEFEDADGAIYARGDEGKGDVWSESSRVIRRTTVRKTRGFDVRVLDTSYTYIVRSLSRPSFRADSRGTSRPRRRG
ncbi:hypothetical protein KM043_001600 [Ampulex compressa]|nr:hypothetical protein KM043_001600 [Ampulex compressa]